MVSTLVVSFLTFAGIIASIILFPKIKIKKICISSYWVIAIIGALALIVFGQISFKEIWEGITVDSSINPLKILILFFSMTFISTFLDEAGFFKFIASKTATKVSGNQRILFLVIYLLTAILTMFTSNDVVILTFTPFICYFSKNTKINPLPYLVCEFAAANTWSMMFIIGNPTNIYLATTAGISFVDYFKVMAIPTLITGIVEFTLLNLLFLKSLSQKFVPCEEGIVRLRPVDTIIGLFVLISCLILLVVSSFHNSVQMWLICAICAGILFVYHFVNRIIKEHDIKTFSNPIRHLPFALIPFIISMFVIVLSLRKIGVSMYLRDFLGEKANIFVYGIASFLGSNIINNIPMSIFLSTIPDSASLTYLHSIYGSIIGSNLGAFLTPIGALAGVMFTNLISKGNVHYSFLDFVKNGIITAIPLLFVCLGITFFILSL